jgi:tetratricopeptide (TPR) repeat protein
MIRPILLLLAVFVVLPVGVAADPPDQKQIERWIQELGSDDADVRERAHQSLWKAGRTAEPALKAALKNPDPDVVLRAALLLNKFKWGIFPDTPADVAALVERYQSGDAAAKQEIAKQLLAKGQPGCALLARFCWAEGDAAGRKSLVHLAALEIPKVAPGLIAEGHAATLEELLEAIAFDVPELNTRSQHEMALRHYAVCLLLRGTLEEKLVDLRGRADKPGGELEAEILYYLLRAKGDLAAARKVAERAGKPELIKSVLFLQRDWKAWAGLPDRPGADVNEPLGYRAAAHRLNGNLDEAEKVFAEIRRLADAKPETDGTIWWGAKALIMNDRFDLALPVLERGKSYVMAFEILCAQTRFEEAFKIADKARAEKYKYLTSLEAYRARILHQLGEREEALRIVARLADHAEGAIEENEEIALFQAEMQVGRKDDACARCARLLSKKQPNDSLWFLPKLFPGRDDVPEVWWKFLRQKYEKEEPAAVMKRLRGLLEGKMPRDEFAALVEEARSKAQSLESRVSAAWFRALAQSCRDVGRDDLAQACLEQGVKAADSADALLHLADSLAAKEKWAEAADAYRRAWGKDRSRAEALFLRGWALAKAGREVEGKKWREVAHFLPLGDEAARYRLAESLSKHGLTEEALREHELILRLGEYHSWYFGNACRMAGRAAQERKDHAAAADDHECWLLGLLRSGSFFLEDTAYATTPPLPHVLRARARAAAGQVADAMKEAETALRLLPGDVNLVIEVVPELEKGGHKKEAEELFGRMLARYESICTAHPNSAWAFNQAAWVAAGCRRHLETALDHARKAVELDPERANYRDTLAEVYFQRGDKAKALEQIKRAMELEPKREYYRKQRERIEAGDPAAPLPPSGR